MTWPRLLSRGRTDLLFDASLRGRIGKTALNGMRWCLMEWCYMDQPNELKRVSGQRSRNARECPRCCHVLSVRRILFATRHIVCPRCESRLGMGGSWRNPWAMVCGLTVGAASASVVIIGLWLLRRVGGPSLPASAEIAIACIVGICVTEIMRVATCKLACADDSE